MELLTCKNYADIFSEMNACEEDVKWLERFDGTPEQSYNAASVESLSWLYTQFALYELHPALKEAGTAWKEADAAWKEACAAWKEAEAALNEAVRANKLPWGIVRDAVRDVIQVREEQSMKPYVIEIRRDNNTCPVYYRSFAIGFLSTVADKQDATHYDSQKAALDVREGLITLGLTEANVSLIGIDRAAAREAW